MTQRMLLLFGLGVGSMLSSARADVLDVPGDYADLQAALDAAPADATIVVHGGTWGPLVISQPVTLLGDPAPALVGGGSGDVFQSAITLAGPGSGRVTLARLGVGGGTVGFPYFGASAAIAGGGFDQLSVIDCSVRATQLTSTLGKHAGASGIDTTVPLLLVERCRVRASRQILFDCAESAPDGVPGIAASQTVVLLDSRVVGGGGGLQFILFGECGLSPCPDGGDGGPGVACAQRVDAASTILGGSGVLWAECDSGEVCCQKADGQPVVASTRISLADDLKGSGPMVLGGPLTLSFSSPGPLAELFVALLPAPPVLLPGFGWLLLELPTLVSLGVFVAPGSQTWALPPDPALVGWSLGFQLLDATTGLTRPVFGALLP